MQLACGELGVSPEVFWNMTMRELINVVNGARNKQKIEYENSWDQARLIAYYSAVVHIKNPPSMTAMIPFPWDKKEKVNWESTPEKYNELVKVWCKN